MCVTWKPVNII